MLHPNKENQRPRGNQRKLAFPGRRRKPAGLAIDPSAPLAARNSFFGTVGSPIKPVKMSDADTDAPAAAGPKLRRPGRPTPRGATSVDPEAATLDVKQKAALRKELARQAVEPDNVATVKAVERHGRRERRRSTEFLGAAVEPAQQLKLDGAKKAKIPHFLSAWFNAGNESKETEGTAATAGSTEDSAAPTAPAVERGNNAADNKKKKTAAEPAVAPVLDARAVAAGGAAAAAAAGVGRADKTKASVGTKAASIDFSEITLGRLIGEGAFGKVHEAKWRGKAVAVKLLICQDLRKDILSEFMSEVEIMSVLRHPNICRLLGASLEPPNRALVVELLQRGSLWGVLRTHRKQIDQDLRSRFIYDTAKGMAYLHHFERPILHRDLKSPNLLVDKNFNIKLSDFGLARVKAHVQTMTGNCGTVQWMAPEVLGNQKYTEKADVFSFGIVIWEIVAGECPYDGMAQIQVALGVLNRNLRPNIPRDCPPFFSRLMKACWNRQPELRPSFPHIVNAFRTYQSSISDSRPSSSAAASAQAAMAASVAAS